MKMQLLATTTAIALIATPMALAQDASGTDTNDSPVFSQEPYDGAAPVDGFYNADPNQILASRFIGAPIYNSASEDAETVGDVNDIIMTPDGKAVATIVGVGGFLGIGEKEVAVSIDELHWQTDADGEMMLVGDLTKEELEGAPKFDRSVFDRDQTASMETQSDEGYATNDEMANAEQRMNADESTDTAMSTDETMDTKDTMGTDETMTSATPKMETVPASEAKLEASNIIGMSVTGADDENIGEVSEILIDDGGKVEAFVIDVGGFLGMNEKPVAVSMDDLQFARAEGSEDWSTIKTGLTKESLENQQAYSEDEYKSDKDSVILMAPVE